MDQEGSQQAFNLVLWCSKQWHPPSLFLRWQRCGSRFLNWSSSNGKLSKVFVLICPGGSGLILPFQWLGVLQFKSFSSLCVTCKLSSSHHWAVITPVFLLLSCSLDSLILNQ